MVCYNDTGLFAIGGVIDMICMHKGTINQRIMVCLSQVCTFL